MAHEQVRSLRGAFVRLLTCLNMGALASGGVSPLFPFDNRFPCDNRLLSCEQGLTPPLARRVTVRLPRARLVIGDWSFSSWTPRLLLEPGRQVGPSARRPPGSASRTRES